MAVKDIRIAIDFLSHPKTRRLIRKLDYKGCYCLLALWISVSQHKPDGELTGWDEDDIEDMAEWDGERGEFVAAMMSPGIKYIVKNEETYSIHEWKEHNPWAAGSEERSLRAKKAALFRGKKTKNGTGLRPETP